MGEELYQLEGEYKMKQEVSPISSLFTTIINCIKGKIKFEKKWINTELVAKDGMIFEIFRHVIIGEKEEISKNAALFIVRFKLKKMSIEKNKKFSIFPIPFFIGLPGFKAKFWMCNTVNGFNQGVYQWETEADAENYSKSFAMKFMTKRSEANSVTFEIMSNTNIYEYVNSIKNMKFQLKR